ncbi:hypothetical protein RYX36_033441 [Vicia faba]
MTKHDPPPQQPFYDQVSWSKQCDDYYDNLIEQNDNNDSRLAIVPWVPQSSSGSSHTFDDDKNNMNTIELMEADEMEEEPEDEDEGAMMDVEQEEKNFSRGISTTLFVTSKHFNSYYLDSLKIIT